MSSRRAAATGTERDASLTQTTGPLRRGALLADVKEDYDSIRVRHAAKLNDRPLLSLAEARENRTPIDWSGYEPPAPKEPGIHVLDGYDLAELRDYIDWQPFFNAWEMKGSFPEILDDAESGETARKLYEDAQAMLDRVVDEGWLTAKGVVGLLRMSGNLPFISQALKNGCQSM